MIEMLHRHAVPLLVFSAGIGDILIEAIKLQSTFYEDNMHVVSNCMEFNDEVGAVQNVCQASKMSVLT